MLEWSLWSKSPEIFKELLIEPCEILSRSTIYFRPQIKSQCLKSISNSTISVPKKQSFLKFGPVLSSLPPESRLPLLHCFGRNYVAKITLKATKVQQESPIRVMYAHTTFALNNMTLLPEIFLKTKYILCSIFTHKRLIS